jgi:hypothetical protein
MDHAASHHAASHHALNVLFIAAFFASFATLLIRFG